MTNDERWFVVRNSMLVLREIAGEKGLLYEHRQLQLVGALDSRLDLQDLVLTLDASFLF